MTTYGIPSFNLQVRWLYWSVYRMRSPVSGVERLSGSYAFTALESLDLSGRREWISTANSGSRAPNLKDLVNRFRVPSASNFRILRRIH